MEQSGKWYCLSASGAGMTGHSTYSQPSITFRDIDPGLTDFTQRLQPGTSSNTSLDPYFLLDGEYIMADDSTTIFSDSTTLLDPS